MNGFDACLPQLQGQIQIKVRRVDTDEYIGTQLGQRLHQALATLEQLRQATEHFHQPHDGQALDRKVGLQPLGFHAWPADSDETDIRPLHLKRLHQPCAEDVTRGFSGDQRH